MASRGFNLSGAIDGRLDTKKKTNTKTQSKKKPGITKVPPKKVVTKPVNLADRVIPNNSIKNSNVNRGNTLASSPAKTSPSTSVSATKPAPITTAINERLTGSVEAAPTSTDIVDVAQPTEDSSVTSSGSSGTSGGLSDFQAAIDSMLANLKAQNNANYEAEVASIKGNVALSIAEQNQAIKQAERDFTANEESINQQVFDAQQASKVSSTRRGISSSQQGEGIRTGINRTGIGLRFKNAQDRDFRLSNIQERISAITDKSRFDIQAAGSRRDAANLGAVASAGQQTADRIASVEDREDIQDFQTGERIGSQEFQTGEREANQDFQLTRDATAFENQLIAMDKTFANDLAKMNISFKNSMAAAAQQNQWAMDRDAVINLAILDRMDLSNDQAKEMMQLQQDYGLEMAIFDNVNARQMATLDFNRKKEFAQLDEARQNRMMDRSFEDNKALTEFQIAAEYKAQQLAEFANMESKQDIIDKAYADNEQDYLFGLISRTPEKVAELAEEDIERILRNKANEVDEILNQMYDPSYVPKPTGYKKIFGSSWEQYFNELQQNQ